MSTRRLLPLVLLLAVGAAIVLMLRRRERDVLPADPIEWTVNPPESAPKGEAFRVVRVPSPEAIRWTGTFSYEQSTTGRRGTERTIPNRGIAGTFTATEATSDPSAAGSAPTSPTSTSSTAVDAIFDLEETVQSAAPAKRSVHAKLSFSRDAVGAVVPRTVKLEAPPDVHTDLELFQFAWTQRFDLPDRPVRVGERLPIDDCVELDETFRRPLWFLFKETAARSGPVSEPIVGGVWVASKDDADGGLVHLRAALTHAHQGTNGPGGPDAVRIDYRAVLDGERTIGLSDGALRRHAVSIARRIQYTARDLDYAVIARARVVLERAAPAK